MSLFLAADDGEEEAEAEAGAVFAVGDFEAAPVAGEEGAHAGKSQTHAGDFAGAFEVFLEIGTGEVFKGFGCHAAAVVDELDGDGGLVRAGDAAEESGVALGVELAGIEAAFVEGRIEVGTSDIDGHFAGVLGHADSDAAKLEVLLEGVEAVFHCWTDPEGFGHQAWLLLEVVEDRADGFVEARGGLDGGFEEVAGLRGVIFPSQQVEGADEAVEGGAKLVGDEALEGPHALAHDDGVGFVAEAEDGVGASFRAEEETLDTEPHGGLVTAAWADEVSVGAELGPAGPGIVGDEGKTLAHEWEEGGARVRVARLGIKPQLARGGDIDELDAVFLIKEDVALLGLLYRPFKGDALVAHLAEVIEPQDGADAQAELPHVKGFGDDVFGPDAEAFEGGFADAKAGYEEDGDMAQEGVVAEAAGNGVAVHARHDDVEDEDVGGFLAGLLDGGEAFAGEAKLIVIVG